MWFQAAFKQDINMPEENLSFHGMCHWVEKRRDYTEN